MKNRSWGSFSLGWPVVALVSVLLFQNCFSRFEAPLGENVELSSSSGSNSGSTVPQAPPAGQPSASMNPTLPAVRLASVIPEIANQALTLAMDQQTANCTVDVLIGWKCIDQNITTDEGKSYKIRVKWSRPGIESKGSVLMAVGGAGFGESRQDPPSRLVMDRLSNEDQLRIIELEFIDEPGAAAPWGGYWAHIGGYRSAGAAFNSAFTWIIRNHIVAGKFLNYLGGSNASTVAAYAMSNYGIDKYFDRVVFQMGPFLPSLQNACNPNSTSSIFLNPPDLQNKVFDLLNLWTFGDKGRSICGASEADRISILGSRRSFPTTHVHVIMGDLEERLGFGRWILASNLEWYQSISARSKERILRPEMAHNNSYKDMRRFLNLSPDQTAKADTDCIDSEGQFCGSGKVIRYNCRGCAQILAPTVDPLVPWVNIGGGCFHLPTEVACSN